MAVKRYYLNKPKAKIFSFISFILFKGTSQQDFNYVFRLYGLAYVSRFWWKIFLEAPTILDQSHVFWVVFKKYLGKDYIVWKFLKNS
jgi:hypothetical protein